MRQSQTTYGLFLQWLLFIGLLVFVSWLFWDLGLLQTVLTSDPTRITLIILLLFVVATGHCAVRSLYLSNEQMALVHIIVSAKTNPAGIGAIDLWMDNEIPQRSSLTGQLMAGVLATQRSQRDLEAKPDTQLLAQVMAERARGQHEVGWFISSLLIKLGLLGTVVGFVLMLAPVAELESFDLSDIQGLLQRMTTGMGVALNTTLVGLSCSMLLGIQYLMLDRAADRLVAQAVHFTETWLFKPVDEGE